MIDPALKELIQKAEAEIPALIEKAEKKRCHQEFADFDCRTLHKMSPEKLASWQAKHPMDSPQYIIALQEWNRRTMVRQVRWMKFSAILAAITAVVTVFIGDILRENRERHKPPQPIEVICKTPDAPTAPNLKEITTQKKTDSQPTKKIIRRQPDGETK
ncbi:MAG: hypothetical protein M0024_00830 [Nitrospiraceae bacterium]|nr:hypothetical protein [Nitrospiraceae bacterium]